MNASSSPSYPAGAFKRAYWLAPSSTGTRTYRVTADPSDGMPVECTCPDFMHRRRQCKHQRAAFKGELGKPRATYGPRPAPRRLGIEVISEMYGS